MTAPANPEPETVPISTPEPTEPVSQDSSPKSIETPESPSIDTLDALTKRALQEQGNEIAALKAENDALKTVPTPVPAPVDKAKEQEKFFDDPGSYMRGLIRDELKTQVEPLLTPLTDYAESTKANTALSNLYNMASADPILGPILVKVRPAVEEMMRNAEPTANNLQQAIYTANGLLAAGRLPANLTSVAPTPVTQTPEPIVSIPPQVPPSPPPAPSLVNKPAGLRQLTEAERAIAKAFNKSDAEYLAYLDAPSDIEGMRAHVDGVLKVGK